MVLKETECMWPGTHEKESTHLVWRKTWHSGSHRALRVHQIISLLWHHTDSNTDMLDIQKSEDSEVPLVFDNRNTVVGLVAVVARTWQ